MKARRWAYTRQSTKPSSWSFEILSAAMTMPWPSKMWSAVMFSREAQTDGGAGPDRPACHPARERGRVRIAEEDLRLPGRRRAFGTRQSGLPDMRLADLRAPQSERGAQGPALPLPPRRCGEDAASEIERISCILGPLRRAAGEREGPIAKQWEGEVVFQQK